MTESGGQRSMCLAAKGWLQRRAAKLLLVRWQSPGILCVRCKFALQLTARRYVSVSVTRRSIRQLSWYSPAGEPYNCPGARRVRRAFCIMAQSELNTIASRYNENCGRYTYPRYEKMMGYTGAIRV
jgi:hypothetical protein